MSQNGKKEHDALHKALAEKLKEKGLDLPIGGKTGSTAEWQTLLQSDPNAMRNAYDAVLDASREIDAIHGTNITQDVWRNSMDGFTP